MDFIFELIFELIFEGSVEISSNKKISKWIRYPILAILISFFLIIILGLIFLGISFLHESILGGIIFIALGIFFLIGSIIKFKRTYLEEKNK